ncbi:uncharacterized membrane protein At3g27390 isoform X2 [Nymphaea colorata]|uniref:uncharacterized membrane protein At3g27390 isoform X2 n=1 Tax=Nymphaea colorata TaxID=210225 RepID=UPI00129E96B8|nr:uncharacterized membrane protein At3g27390 isoform X2 [Nymphaea colorata]
MGSSFPEIESCYPSVVKYAQIGYVVLAFFTALLLGALKGLLFGPVASFLFILGNAVVIIGLFPAHLVWTVNAVLKYAIHESLKLELLFTISTLKVVILLALPVVFSLWLALGVSGSILVGIGYGFFSPWVATFEAFRIDDHSRKFLHCLVDGTWATVKGSCTVVRDCADVCYHSYSQFLKEMQEGNSSHETQTIRLMVVPACIMVGLMGLLVELPLFTVISVVKSPYMLFKGWWRLLHDLVSREGPFLETVCVPIAGLAILLWPLIVVASIVLAIFSSIFVGLYGSIVVYQEKSFRRGIAYVVAMVAEFDEYTNDYLYLREGSCLPKPQFRKKISHHSSSFSVGSVHEPGGLFPPLHQQMPSPDGSPGMLIPNLVPTMSVQETIQEVKMVQIWEGMMRSCEVKGKGLIDVNAITMSDLKEWCSSSSNDSNNHAIIIGLGLPSYAILQSLLYSIKTGATGLVLSGGIEVTHLNGPQDRLFDWFFNPVIVLRDQIKAIKLGESELKFLEKFTLFGGNIQRMEAWENGSVVPQDMLRNAQIQAISRRLQGMTRSISKFPTYRRRYFKVVKTLMAYCLPMKEGMNPFQPEIYL